MTPFFTILVPVYNHEKFVGAALDSLLAQTYSNWEAVVVDDGSTDSTPLIVDAYASRDPRIRVFHKPNGGTASALNTGLTAAVGEWICWLSSDDLFTPEKLAAHEHGIRAHPDVPVFFCGFRRLDDATGGIVDGDQGPLPSHQWRLLGLLDYNFINGITLCVHRSAFERVGSFDTEHPFAQDYGMNLRLLSAYKTCSIPDRCSVTRLHAGQGGRIENRLMFQDCASAAIRFLNKTPFPALFPFADLEDSAVSAEAVERTLDIVLSPHAYMNQLGPHPALALRLMEWLWGRTDIADSRLRRTVMWRLRAAAAQQAGQWPGALWRGLFLLGSASREIVFSEVCASAVAARLFAAGKGGGVERGHLEHYFTKRLSGGTPPSEWGRECRGDLLAAGIEDSDVQSLKTEGWRVSLLDSELRSVHLEPWGLRIGTGGMTSGALAFALCAVEPWEAAVASSGWKGLVAPASRTRAGSVYDAGAFPSSGRMSMRRSIRRLSWRFYWLGSGGI